MLAPSNRLKSTRHNTTLRALRPTPRALLESLEPRLLLTAAAPAFADALTGFFYKRINNVQTSDAAPAVLATGGYSNGALVLDNPSHPGNVTSATIGAGYNPSHPFNIPAVPGSVPGSINYFTNTNYDTQAALDANFPNGQYALAINSRNDGLHTFILTLSSNSNGYVAFNYPTAPHVDHFSTLQAADSTTPITVTWDQMVVPAGLISPGNPPQPLPGNQNDYEQLQITDASGTVVYASPVLGAVDHLSGLTTSTTIPAGTLKPHQTYSAVLNFVKIAAQNTTTYPDVLGVAGFAEQTAFTIRTLPIVSATVSVSTLTPTAPANQPVNIEVDVGHPGSANITPTGTVTLYDGVTVLGTASLSPGISSAGMVVGGQASAPPGFAIFTISTFAAGSHTLTASYSGDSTFVPTALSGAAHLAITPAPFTFPASGQIIVTAPDAGSIPLVKVFDATTGLLITSFLPYDSAYSGPVHVATADVTGDGIPDIITSTGHGGQPLVNVYSGATATLVSTFFAYSPDFTGGVEIAAANVLGTDSAQIITSADAGGQPLVNILDASGTLLTNFYAYSSDYLGGVRIAAARTSSGIGEIVTAPATPSAASPINIFNAADGSLIANFSQTILPQPDMGVALPFQPNIFLAAADANADGVPEIFLGTNPPFSSDAFVVDGATRHLINSIRAYDVLFRGDTRLAALPTTPGHSILVTAPGPGGTPQINLFDPLTGSLLRSFSAYDPSMTSGLFVAATTQPT